MTEIVKIQERPPMEKVKKRNKNDDEAKSIWTLMRLSIHCLR